MGLAEAELVGVFVGKLVGVADAVEMGDADGVTVSTGVSKGMETSMVAAGVG